LKIVNQGWNDLNQLIKISDLNRDKISFVDNSKYLSPSFDILVFRINKLCNHIDGFSSGKSVRCHWPL